MKCPDCGTRLSEIQVNGKLAHRCFKCGGFWTDSDVVNNLSSGVLSTWRRISVDPRWFSEGSGACPLDGMKLTRYAGESVPQTLVVKRCARCGKWWFSGDTLHDYKPAQEAKFNYYRLWGVTANVTEVFLPLLVILIAGLGLGVGLTLVQTKQQVVIPASVGVREFAAMYVGDGNAQISFVAESEVVEIAYRLEGETKWNVEPVERVGGAYMVELSGLEEGRSYIIEVGGREFRFGADYL